MVSGKTIAIAASTAAAVAGLSYIAYFDYKRRNDRTFRRKLKRDRKKVEKTAKKVSASLEDINEQAMELLKIVSKEKLPDSPQDKEQFFLGQVSQGEALHAAGPGSYPEAACRFYQALKVYPNPVELVMIYQKTLPDDLFKLVMAMMAQEVRLKQSRYYDVFPPKDKNVEIIDKNKGKKSDKAGEDKDEVVLPNRGLFATKSFEAGEIIYEEDAVVSSLLPCAMNGRFCHHCTKSIPALSEKTEEKTEEKAEKAEENTDEKTEGETKETEEKAEDAEEKAEETEEATKVEASETEKTAASPAKSTAEFACDKCQQAVYCSEKCRQDAYDAYHQFMCSSSDAPAAKEFDELVKATHELAPVMIARFFGTLVDREKKKELERVLGTASAETSEADEYTTWEHIESMRYLHLIPTASDVIVLRKLSELMSRGVPGLTEFVTGDRYTMLKGKLDYNVFAVHSSAEDDVPAETEKTHVSDTMRDDHSRRAVGLALYLISSHITHDCDPNVEMIFPDNNNKAAIRTLRPVAKGEEIHVSYVDASAAKNARQKVLAGSYRLTCKCDKCNSEKDIEPVAEAEEKIKSETAETKAETEVQETEKEETEKDAPSDPVATTTDAIEAVEETVAEATEAAKENAVEAAEDVAEAAKEVAAEAEDIVAHSKEVAADVAEDITTQAEEIAASLEKAADADADASTEEAAEKTVAATAQE